MIKVCSQPLRPNPFMVYRDPKTGVWKVLKPSTGYTDDSSVPLTSAGT